MTTGNPFLAAVGLRVEPAPLGAGVDGRARGRVSGSMPFSVFYRRGGVRGARRCGRGRTGGRCTDCAVTMTHSGYWARQSHAHGDFDKSMSSTAGDFRGLTAVVLARALERAGTTVCEPLHRFRLEVPPDTVGAVLSRARTAAGGARAHRARRGCSRARSRPRACTSSSSGCRG